MSVKRKYCVDCNNLGWDGGFGLYKGQPICSRADGDRKDIVTGKQIYKYVNAHIERKICGKDKDQCGLGAKFFEPIPEPVEVKEEGSMKFTLVELPTSRVPLAISLLVGTVLVLVAIFVSSCAFEPYTDCNTDTYGGSGCSMGMTGTLSEPVIIDRDGVDWGSIGPRSNATVTSTTMMTTSTTMEQR